MKVLVVYFSFSSQTKNLVHALSDGMRSMGITVVTQRLETVKPLHFPIGSIPRTFLRMMQTFFRQRLAIQPIDEQCFDDYSLIMLAGPTWSYNPSGPVLSLFDRYGRRLFAGRQVLPLISCRGYWRMHWWGLRALLKKCGANVVNLIVFSHPNPEPWRTIGVFLKLAGRVPEKTPWISKYYRKYGHTRDQLGEAREFGVLLGQALQQKEDLGRLDFRTPLTGR